MSSKALSDIPMQMRVKGKYSNLHWRVKRRSDESNRPHLLCFHTVEFQFICLLFQVGGDLLKGSYFLCLLQGF